MPRKHFPESCRNALVLAALLMTGCEQSSAPPAQEEVAQASVLTPELVTANNRGVGQMGQFDYDSAWKTFSALVEQAPDWSMGQFNLAVATLNRQQPGDEDRALTLIRKILGKNPDDLRAHYLAGILSFNAGEIETALEHFRKVHEADPQDGYAAYYVGQSLLQLGRAEAAGSAFERAMAADPYLRSAVYGAFLAAQRTGDRERARTLIDEYQRLERNPRSRLAEIKYTRMGPKAEAVAVRTQTPTETDYRRPGRFKDQQRRSLGAVAPLGPLAAAPLVNDDRSMVLVPDAREGLRLLRLADGAPLEAPFVGDLDVRAAAWGDFDNDGAADLYLAREGVNQLWRRAEEGWRNVTTATTAVGELDSVDALFVDADHDGDLDLFVVNRDGPDELLNNNGDGTFRPLAAERGLGGDDRTRRVLAHDLDGDRDVDLVVFRENVPPLVYVNERIWNYRVLEGPAGWTASSGLALDLGADGQAELCGVTGSALACWQWVESGWQRSHEADVGARYSELAMIDADADGRWELLLAAADRWLVVRSQPFGETVESGSGTVQSVAYPEPGAGPALLVADGGELAVLGPLQGPYLGLSFSGREADGESMRSNRSGLGTRFVVRAGSNWSAGWYLKAHSGPGNGLQPIAVGLDGQAQADYIEIDWSDGVYQTELGLDPGRLHRITETQRQLASCPVLFAWDGERYRFISDVLGVGGIGFAVGPGQYVDPRPRERFRIDGAVLAPRDGAFELKLTEPMEETAYVDAARLVVYDYPPGIEARLDERMATDGAQPGGELMLFATVLAPSAAVNDRGEDVLSELAATDRHAPPMGPLDERYLGLLRDEQVITLDFDRDLSGLADPVLIMDGWIEYGYSQTFFAAWQAGRSYRPPTLEARDGQGRWHTVAEHFGYPAGMPREAAYRLPALPPGTRTLRIRTNQEVYFDRLSIGIPATTRSVETVLSLRDARVERIGFPRRRSGPQRQPDYDYADRAPFWDTRYQRGFYTALGPAGELVRDADNALAIIGPGDALALAFEADGLPPLPPGWSRSFVIDFQGWAKDMDLYTKDGETVGPLPKAERKVDRADELHRRYNTRFLSGR